MKYKASIRLTTGPEYEYIELSVEDEPEAILETYKTFRRILNVGPGLETKVWNKVLDNYRKGKGMDVELHEQMSDEEKWMIHELDKSDSRIKNK